MLVSQQCEDGETWERDGNNPRCSHCIHIMRVHELRHVSR